MIAAGGGGRDGEDGAGEDETGSADLRGKIPNVRTVVGWGANRRPEPKQDEGSYPRAMWLRSSWKRALQINGWLIFDCVPVKDEILRRNSDAIVNFTSNEAEQQ